MKFLKIRSPPEALKTFNMLFLVKLNLIELKIWYILLLQNLRRVEHKNF